MVFIFALSYAKLSKWHSLAYETWILLVNWEYDENKQLKTFFQTLATVNNLNTARYVIQSKKYKEQ